MATIEAVFIDDGGVISDNQRRGPEWQRLVAEYFVPRLGGTVESWASANRALVQPLWAEFFGAPLAGRPLRPIYEAYLVRWLEVMTAAAGVRPLAEPDALSLAWEATHFITARVSASFPGVAAAVERLAERDVTLHTASNEASWELEGYLVAAGIRERFGLLFGADLTGDFKHTGRYYPEMFRLAGVDPTRSVVVDDTPECLEQAAVLGAQTVLADSATGLPGVIEQVVLRCSEAALEH